MSLKTLSQVVLILLLGAEQAQETLSQQHHIQELIDSLPEYSWLRYELQNGMVGPGKTKPYMELMKQSGVRRAFYRLSSSWRHGKPQDVRIIRRLYFSQYDGPHTQIRDAKSLEAIRVSGLQDLLDRLAIERAMSAPLQTCIDRPVIHHPEGKQLDCVVGFFGDPVLQPVTVTVWAPGYSTIWPLADAAQDGDSNGVQYLLQTRQFFKQELDGALFSAVTNYLDNSDVIDLLLRAGADINARDQAGQTPLFIATGRPIEVQALIERGADVNAHNYRGNTALKLAGNGNSLAAQLLREAGARE